MNIYDENDFWVQYPDDWTLSIDDESEADELTIASPEGSFWSLSRYPAFHKAEDLVEEGVAALEEMYEGCDAVPIQEVFPSAVLEGVDVDFFYFDFPCIAMIRGLERGKFSYLLVVQMLDISQASRETFRSITQAWLEHLA
ncbi:MAG: hypothetical protein Q4D38_02700 [Planctomycetia bacterium]|nr:hypothetical protein [Planctomycetia bacterium]